MSSGAEAQPPAEELSAAQRFGLCALVVCLPWVVTVGPRMLETPGGLVGLFPGTALLVFLPIDLAWPVLLLLGPIVTALMVGLVYGVTRGRGPLLGAVALAVGLIGYRLAVAMAQ